MSFLGRIPGMKVSWNWQETGRARDIGARPPSAVAALPSFWQNISYPAVSWRGRLVFLRPPPVRSPVPAPHKICSPRCSAPGDCPLQIAASSSAECFSCLPGLPCSFSLTAERTLLLEWETARVDLADYFPQIRTGEDSWLFSRCKWGQCLHS